jgi:hypothetical protein
MVLSANWNVPGGYVLMVSLLLLDVLFIEYQKTPLLSSEGRPFLMNKKTTWPVVSVDAESSPYNKCSI